MTIKINFGLKVLRTLRILDIRVLLHSLSNRYGCNREHIDKSSNPMDTRVRVNTSIRPSDLLRQRLRTLSNP
jgi:hypothetical protein